MELFIDEQLYTFLTAIGTKVKYDYHFVCGFSAWYLFETCSCLLFNFHQSLRWVWWLNPTGALTATTFHLRLAPFQINAKKIAFPEIGIYWNSCPLIERRSRQNFTLRIRSYKALGINQRPKLIWRTVSWVGNPLSFGKTRHCLPFDRIAINLHFSKQYNPKKLHVVVNRELFQVFR